jgi:predicted deacylase
MDKLLTREFQYKRISLIGSIIKKRRRETMKAYAKLVNNGLEAFDVVNDLHRQGYTEKEIYVLAHESDRTNQLAGAAEANQVGIAEEGMFETVANLFRTRGDALRNKIEAMGFDRNEASMYETELDNGKVLVMARH